MPGKSHFHTDAVLNVLRTARPVQHLLTIPEGLTASQVALLLDRHAAIAWSLGENVDGLFAEQLAGGGDGAR